MTELEYLASKKKIDYNILCGMAHKCKYGKKCFEKPCSQCEFNGNIQYCLEVLLAEHKEKVKLTKNEKAILESIDKDYKWIARDDDGYLHVYKTKPYKDDGWWKMSSFKSFSLFNHLFKFIQWEDDEPYNIQELLANCEVEER